MVGGEVRRDRRHFRKGTKAKHIFAMLLMNSRPACMQGASILEISCSGYSSDGTLPYLMSMQVKTYARDTEATVKYMNDVKNVLAFVCMQHLCLFSCRVDLTIPVLPTKTTSFNSLLIRRCGVVRCTDQLALYRHFTQSLKLYILFCTNRTALYMAVIN